MVLAIIESNCFANQKYLMIKYGPFFLPRVYIYCCESYEKTILVNFCRCITESIFAHFTIVTNITVWYSNCSVLDQKALQRVLKTAQGIAGTPLSATEAVQYITVSAEGVQGHLSPQSQTVSPPPLQETLHKSLFHDRQSKEQLLPLSCQLFWSRPCVLCFSYIYLSVMYT